MILRITSICLFLTFLPATTWAAQPGKDSSTQTLEHVLLKNLPGRPLLVRADPSTRLIPASPSTSASSIRKGDGEGGNGRDVYQQYLIRTTNPAPAGIMTQIGMAAQGHRVQYIPEDTWITMLNQEGVQTLSVVEGIVGIYHTPRAMKRNPPGHQAGHAGHGRNHSHTFNMSNPGQPQPNIPPESNNASTVTIDVSVLAGPSTRKAVAQWSADIRQALGVEFQMRVPSDGKVVIEGASSTLEAVLDWLSDKEEVVWAEQRPPVALLNKYSKGVVQNSTTDASSNMLWSKGLTGAGEVIGCADTGVDYDSCFFRDASVSVAKCSGLGAISNCVDMNHRKIVTYRYFTASDAKDTAGGHGTHVVGSILGAAAGATSAQVAFASQYDGVAKGAKLAFDDISSDGSALWLPDDLSTQLFPHSASVGARLHSNSWGSASSDYTSTAMEMDQYIYQNDNYLILVAAGNSGYGSNTIGSPATAKNILAVGAADHTQAAYKDYYNYQTSDWSLSVIDFSSRGPTSDGRIKPDVVCPGTYIRSASSDGIIGSNQCGAYVSSSTDYGGSVLSMSGTSMATPTCAGAAALVRQYYKEGWHAAGVKDVTRGLEPSAALVKATMIHSGRKMQYQDASGAWKSPPSKLPHNSQGYGRVDLSTVLWFGATRGLVVRDQQVISQGDRWVQCFSVRAGNVFKVSLVWTDPPGTLSASKALVHDLDLIVTTPSGSRQFGNSLVDANGAPVADRLNNAEQLTFEAPTAGVYKVEVYAYSLSLGSQKYALVVTGDMAVMPSCDSNTVTTAAATTPTPAPRTTTATVTTSTPRPTTTTPMPTQAPSTTTAAVTSSTPRASTTTPMPTQATTTATVATSTPTAPTTTPMPTQAPSTTAAPVTTSVSDSRTTTPDATQAPSTTAAVTAIVTTPAPATSPPPSLPCTSFSTLASLSGSTIPAPVTTSTLPMRLRFVSDASIQRDGFLAIVSPSGAAPRKTSCGLTTATLSDYAGIITDGDGAYAANVNCGWLIAPANAASITLKFTAFSTEAKYDFVYVDTCSDAACTTPLSTVKFSGTTLPADVKSSTGFMRVRFTSDYSVQKDGFVAVYTVGNVLKCQTSDAVIQTPMAVVTDGDGLYANSLSCSWRFAPAAATAARIDFIQFNTEAGYDFVYVEQCSGRRSDDAVVAGAVPSAGANEEVKSIKQVNAKKAEEEGWLAQVAEEGEAILKAAVHVAQALMQMNQGSHS